MNGEFPVSETTMYEVSTPSASNSARIPLPGASLATFDMIRGFNPSLAAPVKALPTFPPPWTYKLPEIIRSICLDMFIEYVKREEIGRAHV